MDFSAGIPARRVLCRSLGDAFRDLFDFESWAPKSSQAWRLGTNPSETSEPGWMEGESEEDLQKRVEQEPYEASFSESTDEELAASLSRRVSEASNSIETRELTGDILRSLIFSKWGKSYDVSFVRRDLPFGKTVITLNVLWPHLEQRSFPMSEEEYCDKLDGIAYYLKMWKQTDRVISFLESPAKAKRGLPANPVVGIAVPIQLDLSQDIVDEFFAR